MRIAAGAALAALAFAAPAAADSPVRSSSTLVFDEPAPAFPCDDGRDVLQTFSVTRTVTTFTDRDGTPVRETRQARYAGTLHSDDLARSLPYSGRIRRVLDLRSGSVTITGRSNSSPLPGPGDAVSSGRVVIDLGTDAVVFEAGRPRGEFEALVCGYLYAGG